MYIIVYSRHYVREAYDYGRGKMLMVLWFPLFRSFVQEDFVWPVIAIGQRIGCR